MPVFVESTLRAAGLPVSYHWHILVDLIIVMNKVSVVLGKSYAFMHFDFHTEG